MNITLAILALVVILWWLFTRELPVMFGALVSAGAVRRNWFNAIVVVGVIGALFLPATTDLSGELVGGCYGVAYDSVVLIVMAALTTTLLLDRFGIMPSLAVALLAAMEGWRVLSGGAESMDLGLLVGWCVAPFVAAAIAALLFGVYKVTLGRSHIHIIKLAGYLRYVIIVGVVLAAVAVGLNNGAMVGGFAQMVVGEGAVAQIVTVVVMLAIFAAAGAVMRSRIDAKVEKYIDFSTQAVGAVNFAATITMLLFSTEAVGLVGLRPAPIGIGSTMVGAMLGICLVQRRLVWEGSAIGRALVGVVATPLLAVACYYLLAAVFDAEAMANDEWNATIVVTILLVVILVAFARYVRRQESVKQATKKLLLSQQQQLFENQKALNDMELKTILAENQSLHGTLELKRKEIVNVALGISEQKEFLEMLSEKVRVAAKSSSTEEKDRIIAELQNDLSQRMGSSNEIDEFYAQAEQLHKDFSVKLTEEFPYLTTSERRLATLLRLGFSSKYIATLMNISPKSVEISRYRLRQKLGLQKGDNLINFIKSI